MKASVTKMLDDVGTYAIEIWPEGESESMLLDVVDQIARERKQEWQLGIISHEPLNKGLRAMVFVPMRSKDDAA